MRHAFFRVWVLNISPIRRSQCRKVMRNAIVIATCGGFVAGVTAFGTSASDDTGPQLRKALISLEDCQKIAHQKSVTGTEFVPGVDVYGAPVLSPDLHQGAADNVLRSLKVVVETESSALPGVASDSLATVRVGVISIDENGKAVLNGRRLGADDNNLIESRCQEALQSDTSRFRR